MRSLALIAALGVAVPAAAAEFGIHGVTLGASEAVVKERFPSAHCKALEWTSKAADRRCDDGRIGVAGVGAGITFFLKHDAVQAFDLRFDTRDLARVLVHFKALYGPPGREGTEIVARGGRPAREVFKAHWSTEADRALISSQPERKRSELNVWRGDFAQELYKVD